MQFSSALLCVKDLKIMSRKNGYIRSRLAVLKGLSYTWQRGAIGKFDGGDETNISKIVKIYLERAALSWARAQLTAD